MASHRVDFRDDCDIDLRLKLDSRDSCSEAGGSASYDYDVVTVMLQA